MKKRILKLVMVAVMMFIAVVPMMGCERELTFEEYREMRLEQLQNHINSKNEKDFTIENWDIIQEHARYLIDRMNKANNEQEVMDVFHIAMFRICRIPKITRFAVRVVETEYFRLALYFDRVCTTCPMLWVTTSFKNISDTDFQIVSLQKGTGLQSYPQQWINSLSFGLNGYERDEFNLPIRVNRNEIVKSGASIENIYLFDVQPISTFAHFYKTKPSSNQSIEIYIYTEFAFNRRGEN